MQLVKIPLVLERIQEGLDHMARTQPSLIAGTVKNGGEFSFYFHPCEGLFQRKRSRKEKAFRAPVQQQLTLKRTAERPLAVYLSSPQEDASLLNLLSVDVSAHVLCSSFMPEIPKNSFKKANVNYRNIPGELPVRHSHTMALLCSDFTNLP